MAEPRTVIDVVGAEDGSDHLLEQVVLFVGDPGRSQPGQGVGTVLLFDVLEFGRHQVECFVPARFDELAVFFDQRFGQAISVVDKVEAEPALDAQQAPVGRAEGRLDVDHFVVLDQQVHLAADPAIGTGGPDARDFPTAKLFAAVGQQGAGRAERDAVAAGDRVRLGHVLVEGHCRVGGEAAGAEVDGLYLLEPLADADATAAADAFVEVAAVERVAVVQGEVVALSGKGSLLDAVPIAKILQFAGAGLLTGQAVDGVVGEHQVDYRAARLVNPPSVGFDDHAFGDRGGAGRCQVAPPFHFHHADPAGGGLLVALIFHLQVAQGRNVYFQLSGGIENCSARGDLCRLTVDSYIHKGHAFCFLKRLLDDDVRIIGRRLL